MRHFLDQSGPRLTRPRRPPRDAPDFDNALVDLIAGQSDAQSGHLSSRELERIRDGNLVGFLRALKDRDWGAGLDYVAGGHSYYTAETHILHLREARLGDVLTGSVQVLAADDKRLHVLVHMTRDGADLPTPEHMLLHVDMATGRTCPAAPALCAALMPIHDAHAALPRPSCVGRHVGQPCHLRR